LLGAIFLLSALGLADAEILESEFRPEISAVDLIGLPNYHVYVKLMIDGVVSRAFSGETLGTESLLSDHAIKGARY